MYVYADRAGLQDDKVAASEREVQRESVRFVSTRTLGWNASSNLRIRSVLTALRRYTAVASEGLGRLHGPSAVLGCQRDPSELPDAVGLVAQAQSCQQVRDARTYRVGQKLDFLQIVTRLDDDTE